MQILLDNSGQPIGLCVHGYKCREGETTVLPTPELMDRPMQRRSEKHFFDKWNSGK